MKKTVLVLIILGLCLIPRPVKALTIDSDDNVNSGVKFEKLSFAEVLIKAQKENKYVMVEFFSPT